MSRLEEIKNRYDWVELKPSHIVDVDWLINRVKELENKIKITEFFNELYKERATELEISRKEIAETVKKEYLQNKRYKQALEEILEEAYEEAGVHPDTNMQLETFIVKKARQALKGESK